MIQAACGTTAMGIMPHKDVDKALDLALGLDIPFWPQLPHVSLYEDMYVQSSQNFPGIEINFEKGRLSFHTDKFQENLEDYFTKMESPETYTLTPEYSVVFQKFLSRDLEPYRAVRGQITGPVSFGFKVLDENLKPIIYNDEVKSILFDFMQKKVNHQYQELKTRNRNAFVWVDEPGLSYVFSGLSGYNDQQAKQDYYQFVQGIEGPKGMHLCAEVNLPYLLELGVEILSFDAFQIGFMPREYTLSVAEFIKKGGIISWGIVPTELRTLETQTPEKLASLLSGYWEVVSENTALPMDRIAEHALIAPARCCLVELTIDASDRSKVANIEEKIVEKAFSFLPEMSEILKKRYG